ncbi:hypothetical protein QIV92_24340 [Raoultella ornithinolytica]|nr:hypothetical protein [Raoultella ornithinolytica]
MQITEEQLVKAPSVEVCREAAVSAPVGWVDSFIRVRFPGAAVRRFLCAGCLCE